jgi:uncharacterized protein (TIGR03437 family)
MKYWLLFFATISVWAYPGGSRIPAGNAGEPGTGTPCAGCHTVTLNPSGGSVSLSVADALTYEPGVAQTWTLKISDPDSSRRFGYQLTATAGTPASPNGVTVRNSSGRVYVSQSSASTTSTFTIQWTPPATDQGAITIYVAGMGAKGTRDSKVYTAAFTLQPAAPVVTPPPPAPTPVPTLAAEQPVLNAATGLPAIASGVVVSVTGTTLTPGNVSRHWTAAPDADGLPPLELAGVRVRINSQDCRMLSVTPARVLALTPDDDARGSMLVQVLATHGDSATVEVQRVDSAPGVFARGGLVLAHHPDGALVAAPAEFDAPWIGRPAQSQLPLILTLTGLPIVEDLARLEVKVADTPAKVEATEAAGPGLTKVRITLPDLADGDHPLQVSFDGNLLPGALLVPVRR